MVAQAAEKLSGFGPQQVSEGAVSAEQLLRHLINRSFPLSLQSMQRIREKIQSGSEEGQRMREDWEAYLQTMKVQQFSLTEAATEAARDVIGELSREQAMPSSAALLHRWIDAFEHHHAKLAHDERFARDYATLFGLAIRLTRRYPEATHA